MKKFIIIITILLLMPLYAMGHEGMWLPGQIGSQTYKLMKEMGLELSPSQIYSPSKPSLSNAVVSFGGFCSGVVVSPDGLVFTNHHCGFEAIQLHSTEEHNYVRDGFAAQRQDDELPNSDLFVSFLVRMENVTDRIVKGLPKDVSEEDREAIVDSLSMIIENEAIGKDTLLRAEVTPFYDGNEYYLSLYKDYYDVRLVFSPPSSIGKFGGDTDNWVWPRHTGDFSVFRIYAGKDNQPAQYSEDNVPYHPDYFVPVSLDGYREGSFCMTLGYPGVTERFLSSFGVEEIIDVDNTARIDARGVKQAIWKEAMLGDEMLKLKYSSKYAQSSNYWKNSIGENRSIKRLGIIEQKRALEAKLMGWIRQKPEERGKFASVLTELKLNYDNRREKERAMYYFGECFANGPEIITAALAILNFDSGADKNVVEHNMRKIAEIYANMDVEVDKKVFKALLKLYGEKVGANTLPDVYGKIEKEYKGDIDMFVDELYSKSVLDTGEGFERVANGDTTFVLFNDPAAAFAIDMIVKYYEFNQDMSAWDKAIEKNERMLTEAIRQMESDKENYPDANSTMRISFGSIGMYSPKDGVEYDYYTTIKGVSQKVNDHRGDSDFDLIPSVAKLMERSDYGRYASKDGNMNVCFISNNDITGGNSGSGMFNGKGELIGLAFDGNWEAMSSDISFEPSLQRCIGVDVRYMLYIMEQSGKAQRIIDELVIR